MSKHDEAEQWCNDLVAMEDNLRWLAGVPESDMPANLAREVWEISGTGINASWIRPGQFQIAADYMNARLMGLPAAGPEWEHYRWTIQQSSPPGTIGENSVIWAINECAGPPERRPAVR